MGSEADQRGMSLSTLVVGATFAILVVAGLVVDGGQRVRAARFAEAAAAAAARAGADAYATGSLAGVPEPGRAIEAAGRHLADGHVAGTVTLRSGTVVVRASSTQPTVFLSVIGITEVGAEAEASAALVRGGADSRPSARPPR